MQTTTGSVYSHPPKPKSQPYHPSVPLSVYRELADELHTTQAKLDALTAKNQQLTQENQLLRHEITKVVQSFLHLQKLVDSPSKPKPVASTKSDRSNFAIPLEISSPIPETILIEEQEVVYHTTSKAEAKEINGWWLAITILLIMLSAFGAGYLIVRPLLEHRSR